MEPGSLKVEPGSLKVESGSGAWKPEDGVLAIEEFEGGAWGFA